MTNSQISDLLLSKSVNLHYAVRYLKFINWCKTTTRPGKTEKHHILPKAKTLFPEYASLKQNPWNKVALTGHEHFIAHWLLWKAMGQFMAYAFSSMRRCSSVQDRYFKLTGKAYEQLRTDVSVCQSSRTISQDTLNKMSKSQKLRAKIICPHCGASGDPANMKKYHFDKCKSVTGHTTHQVKQNHTIVTCPHCNKTGKAQGMMPNHFDNCPVVRGDYRKLPTIVCPHCGTEGKDCDRFKSYHFSHCFSVTGIRVRKCEYDTTEATCPHCGKVGKMHGMKSKHFANCKFNPAKGAT